MENNNIEKFIFKSDGHYLGFIRNSFLFSRDGVYLGWLENNFAWNNKGMFRGVLRNIGGNNYILIDKFSTIPIPRSPKSSPNTTLLPDPPSNISPISLPIGFADGFEL